MASLPTRTTASFDAIKPVSSLVPLDDELNDMKGANGFLNGGTSGKKLLIKTSDGSDPPVDCDQLGAGPLARFKLSGTAKVTIGNDGLITCANTGVNPGLNADRVDGIEGANIAKLDTAILPWSATWFYADPSAAAIAEDQPELLVPANVTAFIVTHIRVEYRQGSHTAGGSVTFTLRRRGAVNEDLGTISLDNTNNTSATLYTTDIADKTLAAGDRIFFLKSAGSGTISERAVSVFAEGTRRLT